MKHVAQLVRFLVLIQSEKKNSGCRLFVFRLFMCPPICNKRIILEEDTSGKYIDEFQINKI